MYIKRELYIYGNKNPYEFGNIACRLLNAVKSNPGFLRKSERGSGKKR